MAELLRFSLIIGTAMEHFPKKIPGINGDFPRRQWEISVTEIFELPCFIKSIDFPLSRWQHSGRDHPPYALQ